MYTKHRRRAGAAPCLRTVPIFAAATALLLCASPGPALFAEEAQRPRVTVRGAGGVAFRVAVQRLSAEPHLADRVREVDTALLGGLEFSSLFDVIPRDAFPGPVLSPATMRAPAPRCSTWRQVSADALLQGRLSGSEDSMQLEFRLYDIARCRALVRSKRIRAPAAQAERIGRRTADLAVAAFGETPGVADTELAFISDRSGYREVWVAFPDGSAARAVTEHQSSAHFPGWTPDGESLVYTSYRYQQRPWLFVASRAGRRSGRLLRGFPHQGTQIYRGVFAPLPGRLALVMSRKGASEIYIAGRRVLDGESTKLGRLTRNRHIDISPSWSPDGSQLAYVSDRTGSPEIYVVSAKGGRARRLTFGGAYNTAPAWSPSGRWIAYQTRHEGQFDLWLIDPEGRHNQPLVTHPRSDEQPSWSPDGRKLAFQSLRRGRFDIYVIDLDGSKLRRVTTGGSNTSPAWGPYRSLGGEKIR